MKSPSPQTTTTPRNSPPPSDELPRGRLPSSDIPRTYSGLYGEGGSNGDLLPFELSRNRNTDWVDAGGVVLLLSYISILFFCQCAVMVFLPFRYSWTVTSVGHGFLTLVYLHWIKGSPNFYEQGEMNAMTLWEQIASAPSSDPAFRQRKENQRKALFVVPTILCYIACVFGAFDLGLVSINVVVWVILIVAKLPFMHGVRILGINSTAGIDDEIPVGKNHKTQ